MTGLHWITPDEPADSFPSLEQALRDPDGLLAVGGDLGRDRLLSAYRKGIFPWFNPGQPVLWWSPDPRAVLFPAELHLSRRLRRTLKRQPFDFSIDNDFNGVIQACATTARRDQDSAQGSTWITADMLAAYSDLHAAGHAHSVETWHDGRLIGGIYGVALGSVFFGESMFSREADASKAALAVLVRELMARDFVVLDCQVASSHLASLGSREIPRSAFRELLDIHAHNDRPARWKLSVPANDLFSFEPAAEARA